MMKAKKAPVYCASCKFSGCGGALISDCDIQMEPIMLPEGFKIEPLMSRRADPNVRCMHPNELEDVSDFWCVRWDSSTLCRDKNRDNNCPDFEKYRLVPLPPPPPERCVTGYEPSETGTKLRGKSVIKSALESLSEMNHKMRRQ